MKKKIAVGIIVMLIVIGLSGCTQDTRLDHLGYANYQYGFGLNPPEGWTIDESGQNDDVVGFNGPTMEGDFAVLYISKPYDLIYGVTLFDVAEETIEYCNTNLSNFTLISKNNRTINGMNSYEIVYTMNISFLPIKAKQVMVEMEGKYFYITFTALSYAYDSYLPVIEQSINSFTINIIM